MSFWKTISSLRKNCLQLVWPKKKKKMGVQAAEGKSATYHLAQNEARITSYCLPFVIIPMPNIE